MAVRARLVVRGLVQGVWYRGSMQQEARRLGLAGWVSPTARSTPISRLRSSTLTLIVASRSPKSTRSRYARAAVNSSASTAAESLEFLSAICKRSSA